ncbi:MAG: Yip1 family protein [Pseudomonadota bacterium]
MNGLLTLMLMSLRTPRQASAFMIGLEWPRSAIWTALVLAVAVNILLLAGFLSVAPIQLPAPDTEAGMVTLAIPSPLMMFIVSSGWAVLSVHLLTWTGRALGGTGTLDQVAAVWVLLQALRAVGVLALIVAAVVLSPIAGLVGIAVMFLTIWLSAQFIAEAHAFDSAWQGLGVLIAVFVGLMIGLMALLTVTGLASNMGAGNV